jgi:hypothetical protein
VVSSFKSFGLLLKTFLWTRTSEGQVPKAQTQL